MDDSLEAENARLRAALQTVMDYHNMLATDFWKKYPALKPREDPFGDPPWMAVVEAALAK